MNSLLYQSAVRHGLLIGIAAIIAAQLLYAISTNAFITGQGIVAFGTAFFFLAYFGRKERNTYYDGFLSFKQAYVYSLIALSISYYFYQTYYLVLCNWINPDLQDMTVALGIESTESMMEMLNTPQEKIDAQIEMLEQSTRANFDFSTLVKYSWSFIGLSAFFSLFAGLIIKKSKPDFE